MKDPCSFEYLRFWGARHIVVLPLGALSTSTHLSSAGPVLLAPYKMPRIRPSLIIKAYNENPLLPLLVKECRSLDSARNELRWLRERALRDSQSPTRLAGRTNFGWRTRLRVMCRRRSRGYPLQYILGDQPFGDLEILCRRGVLIPRCDRLFRNSSSFAFLTLPIRPDTESYTLHAAKLIRSDLLKNQPASESAQRVQPLRILDLCTGTGCIPLLLHALLFPHCEQMQILGIDISPKALDLARLNLRHNVRSGRLAPQASDQIEFHQADVLGRDDGSISRIEDILSKYEPPEVSIGGANTTFDLLISNPPYISTSDFRNGTTARSVRLFEPRLALVPPAVHSRKNFCDRPEDIFYARILALSLKLRPRLVVLECGDLRQAHRVVNMHQELRRHSSHDMSVEVWPSTDQDLAAHGFHPHEGSRCVIFRSI